MKRTIVACIFCLTTALSFAQTGEVEAEAGTMDSRENIPVRTEHFEIIADAEDGEILGRQMEDRFAVYNKLFRFDPANAAWPLKVRAFRDQAQYEGYVGSRLGSVKPGAVYLHYNHVERRELVINTGDSQALPYQAFIQYLRAFVSNPPSWIREGFAVFFSTVSFNDEGKLIYEENLAWLETIKKMQSLPSPGSVMMADVLGTPENFQSLAWSLVSFFLNSGKRDYLRTLTDSFMLLLDTRSAEDNAEAVMKRIFLWNNMEDMTADYHEYIDSRKSFTELIAGGQRAYAGGDLKLAEAAFRSALEQRPAHYAPWYYLGLLAYDAGDSDTAEQYYRISIRNGADMALVLYALGLNAATAGKYNEAKEFLRQAAEADPGRYREKADALITRLKE
jgi:tetratricopeptide (TPR) repeat protein